VEARPDRARFVQRCHAEIDCLGLMVDLHVERSTAGTTESPMAEAARRDAMNRLFAGGEDKIINWHAGENHCWRAAAELAGPAMTPASVERFARQPEAD
jgi:hypothetical protein